MRLILLVIFAAIAAIPPGAASADALAAPPAFVRSWRVTAATASAAKSLLLAVSSPGTPVPSGYLTQSVQVKNEDTVAAETIFIRLSRDSEAPTANSTEGDLDEDFRLDPGETITIDGRFRGIAYIRGVGDAPLRIIATY